MEKRALIPNRLTVLAWKLIYRNKEWFDLVSPQGDILGTAPRDICHRGPGRLHAVVHLHVINGGGDLYLQKRSLSKDIQPGKWDTAVGGHVNAGETVEKALFREAEEELAIREFSPRFLFRYVWESDVESELVHVFAVCYRGRPIPDPGEIQEGRFWFRRDIEALLGSGIFTPNFEQEYPRIRQVL